ncbi:MAG TPA: sigma-70 family RNA polymerase sigma factor [Solirubrobacterales bacterium]|nr:sigma-70 family RNA polymerase sigma factor [Solirubrobacterales bacterium]
MKPFELLIEEHGPAILRFCAGRVGPERAEDCFQDTMLAALRSYGDLRDEKAVKSWLFTIAARKTIDIHRASARIPVPAEEIEEEIIRRAEWQPGSGDIWSLVHELPEKQAIALQLRFRGGLSHREVGEVMEISEAAARRNVFEGLKRLREERSSWL